MCRTLSAVTSGAPRLLALALLGAVLASLLVLDGTTAPASAAVRPAKCDRFDRQQALRERQDQGTGAPVTVIGDSFSIGTGLPDMLQSWPSRLPGRVHVDGHPGSGFSNLSSPCGPQYAFHRRVARATAGGPELVVVQGGINDWDRTDAQIAAGFARLALRLAGRQVLVVGPVMVKPPRLAARIAHLDRLLATQSRWHGMRYLSMSKMVLPKHADGVHLAPYGHVLFGDKVAAVVAEMLPVAEPEPGPADPGT